jgi:hypothetical protein
MEVIVRLQDRAHSASITCITGIRGSPFNRSKIAGWPGPVAACITPGVRPWQKLAAWGRPHPVRRLRMPDFGDGGDDFRPDADAADGVVHRVLAVRHGQGRDRRRACSGLWRSALTRRRGRCWPACGRCWCARGGTGRPADVALLAAGDDHILADGGCVIMLWHIYCCTAGDTAARFACADNAVLCLASVLLVRHSGRMNLSAGLNSRFMLELFVSDIRQEISHVR